MAMKLMRVDFDLRGRRPRRCDYVCSDCGQRVPGNALFCPYCGEMFGMRPRKGRIEKG